MLLLILIIITLEIIFIVLFHTLAFFFVNLSVRQILHRILLNIPIFILPLSTIVPSVIRWLKKSPLRICLIMIYLYSYYLHEAPLLSLSFQYSFVSYLFCPFLLTLSLSITISRDFPMAFVLSC